MRLRDLSSIQNWLPSHPTAEDRLWNRDALQVNEAEIQLYYARSGANGKRKDAIDAIDALQGAVLAAAMKGELKELPGAIFKHTQPISPFLVDELVSGLTRMRPARRQACLFSLESGDNLADMITLTWKEVRARQQLAPLCSEILASAGKTRHLKLDYVFWEWATTSIAAPLIDLTWSVESAFDCSWTELRTRYRSMIKLNRGADCASFLELTSRASH